MNRTAFKVLLVGIYLLVGAVGVAYLAAALYFLVNKVMPASLAMDTWWRYWNAYRHDPVQSHRLIGSAVLAIGAVYVAPLALVLSQLRHKRSLHGDARWATEGEIRKAGLL
jgi:type IV secretion system protein VirD4